MSAKHEHLDATLGTHGELMSQLSNAHDDCFALSEKLNKAHALIAECITEFDRVDCRMCHNLGLVNLTDGSGSRPCPSCLRRKSILMELYNALPEYDPT